MARFNKRTTADEVVAAADITGRVMLVTGANTGIGFETARALAAGGARVYLGCRSESKGNDAIARIRERHPDADARLLQVDLGSFESIRAAADAFDEPKLDVLICNAGVYGGGYAETSDGLERVIGVSHVGHFLLVHRLMPKLEAAAPSRVIMVSSGSHRAPAKLNFGNLPPKQSGYSDITAYGQAKLCNVLFANELHRRVKDRGVSANSLHPGALIGTDIGRSSLLARVVMTLASPFTRTLAQGAATSCYVATAPELEGVGGEFFDECQKSRASDEARDPQVAGRLWDLTEGWAQLADDEKV